MSELWRDLVELLRRRPLLWVPVLVADLLGYLLNLGRLVLLRDLVLQRTMQHSALGGAVVQTQMTAAQMQNTTVMALLLSWLCYFMRLLMYSGAFMVTASLVNDFVQRTKAVPEQDGRRLRTSFGGIFELGLRALVVYVTAALLYSSLTSFLVRHEYTAVLRNAWFGLLLGLIVLILLAAWLPPVAMRLLNGRQPGKVVAGEAQQLAAMMALLVTVLTAIVGSNSRQMGRMPQGARIPLEMVGSLVEALPYVFAFTGVVLLARRAAQALPDAETDQPG